MKKKKIIYIVLLILVLAVVGIFVFITVNRTERLDVTNSNDSTNLGKKGEGSENVEETSSNKGEKEVTVNELDDGTLYSVTDEDIVADIIIGDNYFDTQIADISLNFSKYKGKTIEIEGMYLTNNPYTFVGRYSTANLCADCPQGYSYIEYEWKGDTAPELKEEESWLKVKGTLKSAYDIFSRSEYYYIDVLSLEVMKEQGLKTVNN